MKLKDQFRRLFPFTKWEALFSFGVPFLMCLVVSLSLSICNKKEDCGNNAWRESFWGDKTVGTGFCEDRNRDNDPTLLSEKANAISNFAYCYFGLVLYCFTYKDCVTGIPLIRNYVVLYPITTFVYAVSMVYLGIGSFFFHAGGNEIQYAHDQASIFVHFVVMFGFTSLLWVPMEQKFKFSKQALGVVAVATMVGLIIMLWLNLARKITSDQALKCYFAFVAMNVVGIVSFLVKRRLVEKIKPTAATLCLGVSTIVIFIVALIVQEEFVAMPCHPLDFFQFHALWHVLTAIGFFDLYLIYRSVEFPDDIQIQQNENNNQQQEEGSADNNESSNDDLETEQKVPRKSSEYHSV